MSVPAGQLAILPADSSDEPETIPDASLPTAGLDALVLPVVSDLQNEALAELATEPTVAPEASEDSQTPFRILLVEDHLDTCDILSAILRRRGFQVSVATNMAGALRLLATDPFDLLISDLGLPDATGYDLLLQAREIRPLPAIAMSGFGMPEDLERSRLAGFSEHLTKPVMVDQLVAAIRRARPARRPPLRAGS